MSRGKVLFPYIGLVVGFFSSSALADDPKVPPTPVVAPAPSAPTAASAPSPEPQRQPRPEPRPQPRKDTDEPPGTDLPPAPENVDAEAERFASPQHFALELRFTPFTPDIDSDPALGGKTPYHDAFGVPSQHLLIGAELDVQPLRVKRWGSLGAGFAFNYTSMSGSTTRVDSGLPGAGSSSLDIFPMYLVAVVRADALRDQLKLPLVPYAKAGVGLAFWRATKNGTTSSGGGNLSGKGHSWGSQLVLGVALDLGWIDRRAARNLDESVGVNHTYLYGEWMWMNLGGFGDPKALRVGASTWSTGLTFEF